MALAGDNSFDQLGPPSNVVGRWDALVGVPQPVDEHPDFDARNHYSLKESTTELSDVERNAAAGLTSDDIHLTEHAPVLLVDQRPELRKGVAILGAVGPLLAGNHIVECRHRDDDPVKVQLRGTSDELRV